ncbi:hypothetical protein ACFQZ8_30205, partial [Micromonospora azadirachtae]
MTADDATTRARWHAGRVEETFPVRRWRVPASLPAAKIAGAILLMSVGLLFADGDPVRLALAALVAAALAGWA